MPTSLVSGRVRADDSGVSETNAGPPAGMRGVLPTLRRRVGAGEISRVDALVAGGSLVVVWLVVGVSGTVLLVGGAYTVALLAVSGARGSFGELDEPLDPAVLAVTVALVVTAVGVVAVATTLHRRRTARHRAHVQAWADTHGWHHAPRSTTLSSRWDAPGLRGGGPASDVLTRQGGHGDVVSVTVRTGVAGPSRHAVFTTGPRLLPTVSLTPLTRWDRVARALGGQQVVVESHEHNERWRMRGADPRLTHEVLHPRLLERLAREHAPGLSLLVQEGDVVVHVPGPTRLPAVEHLADLALDVADLLPRYLPDDFPPFAPDVPRRDRRRLPGRRRR